MMFKETHSGNGHLTLRTFLAFLSLFAMIVIAVFGTSYATASRRFDRLEEKNVVYDGIVAERGERIASLETKIPDVDRRLASIEETVKGLDKDVGLILQKISKIIP